MVRDYLSDVLNSVYNNIITEWRKQGISEKEIIEKLNQDVIDDSKIELIKRASNDYYKYFLEKRFEISYSEKIHADSFAAHQNEIWGECFAVSETMYVMAVEAAEHYSKFVNDNISKTEKEKKQYTFLALQYMQGRCCQEFLEILYLIKLGFADCAYARWRSMYEICCTASFIIKQGEIIAKQYIEQSQSENQRYDWTKGAKKEDGTELIIKNFQGIQNNCDVDEAWKKQYKLACFVNHASPQGTFKRLGLKKAQSIIAVGQSDYGITTPAEHSAISLQWITSMFLTLYPCLDAMTYAKVIHDWVKEVRKSYFSTANKVFGTEINIESE